MRHLTLSRLALLCLLWAACSASSPAGKPVSAPESTGAVSPEPAPAAGGPAATTCLGPEDCPGGVCEGEGCGDAQPGHCVAAVRACTKDLRPYCSCDGQTFRASGSCPGRRYAHRGPCEGETVPAGP